MRGQRATRTHRTARASVGRRVKKYWNDTRAVEASVVSSAPPIVETEDGVTHETWPTPTEPLGGSSHLTLNRETKVQRLAHKGLEAASCRTRARGEFTDEPNGLCPTRLEVDRVISTFSFDPNL